MVTRHRPLLLSAAVAALASVAPGCSGPGTASAAATPASAPPTVAAARIVRSDLVQTLSLAAEFRPFQEIDVHAKVAGFVKTINVDVGDRVRQGQLLAELEVPELRDELQQGEAAVNRSAEEIKRAQADLERAESAHELAHLASTRLAGVVKARPNLVAQQDLDDAAARDRMAEAQVSTSKAALAAAQEQLAGSKAAANRAKTLLDYSRITAPFAGVITHRYADTGAMIQAGTSSQTQAMPIVKLSQNDRLRLVIPVPESAVPRIHLGGTIDIAVQSLHRNVTGTVARFADRLDTETRTMHVEVDVMNPTLELVPGMYADATIVLDEARDAVVAPVQALDRNEDGSRVFVVGSDGRLDARKVTVGLEAADRVQVTQGLSAGDLVVIGSRAQLKPGSVVTPKVAAQTPETGGR